MNNQHLYNFVREILKEWNPIGVPVEIADEEYEDYIPSILQISHNEEQIEKELVSVLKHIGFHKSIIHKKEVQQNIKDIAKKIYEYQQKMNRESRTIWKEEIYQESKDHGVSST